MKVVVMAGGEGRRLRPLTNEIPKPLLPIGKKPLLQIIIEKLKSVNLNEIIIATGYKENLIRDYFQSGKNLGVNITYSCENQKLGTAGPLKLVEKHLSDPFLVINGDILTKFNFKDIINYHFNNGKLPTIGVIEHKLTLNYGVVITTNGIIKSVQEKPHYKFLVLAGIYLLNKESLKFIPDGKPFDLPDLLNTMVNNNIKVKYYPIPDNWMDIGSLEEYEKAIKNIENWL